MRSDPDLDEARIRYAQALAPYPGPRQIDTGLWWLEARGAPASIAALVPGAAPPNAPVVVAQQAFRSAPRPRAIPGYRLVHDGFSNAEPRLFRLGIARTLPGYGFAVYIREAAPIP
ncbi:MAG: hypothetical protein H0W72_04700 [Planctomycetes bacterium]|nr:hypothetical protein [Planctomycetota bacterium]